MLEQAMSSAPTFTTTALSFSPGDLIQTSEFPFVKILATDSKGTRCDWCFKRCSTLEEKCDDCDFMFYCNQECKEKDFQEGHMLECAMVIVLNAMKKTLEATYEPLRRVLRLHSLLLTDPQLRHKKQVLHTGISRSFQSLQSHSDEVKKDKELSLEFRTVIRRMNHHAKEFEVEETLKLFQEYAGIWTTNAIELTSDPKTPIGSAIYLKASSYNHWCRPNAIFHFLENGLELEVRAIQPITAVEQPHVNYLKEFIGLSDRASHLKNVYHFVCECGLCNTEKVSGDATIYKSLRWDMETFKHINGWKEISKQGTDLLKTLKKVYSKYDERRVDLMFLILKMSFENGAPKPDIEKWAKKCKKHFAKSFGTESEYFKQFRTMIDQNGISVELS